MLFITPVERARRIRQRAKAVLEIVTRVEEGEKELHEVFPALTALITAMKKLTE